MAPPLWGRATLSCLRSKLKRCIGWTEKIKQKKDRKFYACNSNGEKWWIITRRVILLLCAWNMSRYQTAQRKSLLLWKLESQGVSRLLQYCHLLFTTAAVMWWILMSGKFNVSHLIPLNELYSDHNITFRRAFYSVVLFGPSHTYMHF